MKIVRFKTYLRAMDKLMSQQKAEAAESVIAAAPLAYPVIPGTGGLRKARIAVPGRGKRGGARVIFCFWQIDDMLLFVDAYAKNESENLSPSDAVPWPIAWRNSVPPTVCKRTRDHDCNRPPRPPAQNTRTTTRCTPDRGL